MSMTAEEAFLASGHRLDPCRTIHEYWIGPAMGPINARWRDKPAQVPYDVVGEVVHLTAERDAALAAIERLKAFAQKVLDLAQNPDFGTIDYMEGGGVSDDLRALEEAASALLQGDGT